jgi:DNA polymerase II large subunit
MDINAYFAQIEQEVKREYEAISKIRKVTVPIARNPGERIEGLLSIIKPQLLHSGLAEFILEQNKKFGPGSWKAAINISLAVSRGEFVKFSSDIEAIEMGIRAGLAYTTAGIVSAPLEGFIKAQLKDRTDKKGKYLAVFFGGPIRGAGGTDAAFTIVVADALRHYFGLEFYDPTNEEVQRAKADAYDYYEKAVKYQYLPSYQEIEFFWSHLPVEIDGEPTEEIEVSAFKNLPRIQTNRIRGGMVLVLSSFIQKSSKVLKNLNSLGNSFGFESDFSWLPDLIKIKEAANAKDADTSGTIKPNYKYLEEIAAGRPVLSYPLRSGGFRLRYGRCRTSGIAAAAIHPATSKILYDFIATGTQLKVEFPGKAAAITFCDSIEGPIVKLKDESVVKIRDLQTAEILRDQIEEILYLGDMLVAFGEFTNNNHVLVPSPFVEEWWNLLAKKAGVYEESKKLSTFEQIKDFCIKYNLPLHPKYLYFWSQISKDQLLNLITYIRKYAKIERQASFGNEFQKTLKLPYDKEIKRALELIGIEHKRVNDEIVINNADALLFTIGIDKTELPQEGNNLEILSKICGLEIKDIAGTFIGARLGRPEKAKMREMEGHPNVIFPIGESGGNSRSIIAAAQQEKIVAEFGEYVCPNCHKHTIYRVCEDCGIPTIQLFKSKVGNVLSTERTPNSVAKWKKEINLKEYLDKAFSKVLKYKSISVANIKGVKGVFNDTGAIEPLEKGILRAYYDLYVNKDGTVRFDAIEVPITHFRPKEIGVSVEKLRELGYDTDIYGNPLERDDQILQLLPQDVILPCYGEKNNNAADVLFRVSKFVDDLLVINGQPPLFNLQKKEDLIGKLIVGLAPHTSSGIVGRIIGFSKTQGYFAHPYFHTSMRRNCDGDEAGMMLLADLFLNFDRDLLPSTRGAQFMDAPLVISAIMDIESADPEVHNLDIVQEYPLELYEASLRYSDPSKINSQQIKSILSNPFTTIYFTHDTSDINAGVNISAYKELETMREKVEYELEIEKRIRAVDVNDVVKIIIDKHLLKDIKGNLRNFGIQEFRCIKCNTRYERPPLSGKCKVCGGNLVPITSKGNVLKYLNLAQELAAEFDVGDYLRENLKITVNNIKSIFGEDEVVPKRNATLLSQI